MDFLSSARRESVSSVVVAFGVLLALTLALIWGMTALTLQLQN